jgi:hypothetical protein
MASAAHCSAEPGVPSLLPPKRLCSRLEQPWGCRAPILRPCLGARWYSCDEREQPFDVA